MQQRNRNDKTPSIFITTVLTFPFYILFHCILYIFFELPLTLVIATAQTLAKRPIVRYAGRLIISTLTEGLLVILSDPRVPQAAAPLMVHGLQAFLQSPDTQQHIVQQCVQSALDSFAQHPEWARKQGEEFPVVLGSFLQGLLHAAVTRRKSNTTTTKDNKSTTATEQQQQQHQQRLMVLNVAASVHRSSITECKDDDQDQ